MRFLYPVLFYQTAPFGPNRSILSLFIFFASSWRYEGFKVTPGVSNTAESRLYGVGYNTESIFYTMKKTPRGLYKTE